MGQQVLNRWTTFTIGASPDSWWKWNKKFGNSRSIFEFRKLNKIARGGLKIQKFAWRYKIQFETLFTLARPSKYPRILN
jgi:hypothetical protein